MKIHDLSGFPNPARTRILVAEKGLEARVEFVRVDLVGAEHKKPAFLAKNPTGVVPVLELDDGTFITESVAIAEILDNLDGQPTLTGRTPLERARILMMHKRADDQLIDAIGIYFHHATPGLGDDLLAYKSPDWALRQEWGRKHGEKFAQGMAMFDRTLQGGQPYVAGDTFSIADIAVWAALLHGSYSGLGIPEDHAALKDWHARVSERPSVKHRSGQALDPQDVARLGPLFAYLEGLPKAA